AKGKLGDAIASIRRAIELDPNTAEYRGYLALALNDLAWCLATDADPKPRDAGRAVTLAKESAKLAPAQGNYWTTLGVAHFRAAEWKAAQTALEKSMELRKGGDAFDWFFLAMAHWQLDRKAEASKWYEQAVQWMDKNAKENDQLRRFRREAEELLRDQE